ncbi:MAG: GNAT family N-acetyltransferase [Deltaproteobacteria bacterium]|nr:GNAT family N-acetyltransferase [Deltaproteobacteria bacterium]MCB9490093.1 GNAT family N-acetyltransferase [Deltaproteobacteria bacterium]
MKALRDEFEIQHATLDDLPRVLDLWRQLMELTATHNDRYRLSPGAMKLQMSYLRSFMDSTTAAIYIAKSDGLIVGFTDIYTTKPAPVFEQKVLGVIENIYVLPEYRRLHIGEHLVHWARRFFENLRVGEIFVNVIPTNETSVVFWESMGFRTQKLSMTWKSPNLP